MFIEKAPGITWNQLQSKSLSVEEKNYLKSWACIIFTSLIHEDLQKNGFFNPDSHLGNIMIDLETRTVSIIDMGQSEVYEMTNMFKSDDRLMCDYLLDQLIHLPFMV